MTMAQSTAVEVRRVIPGNVMSVREIYADMDNAYRFAKALSIGCGHGAEAAAQSLAKMVVGAELGIGAAASVRGIHFIKARLAMSADLMVALAQDVGWSFATSHSNPPGQWCKVRAHKGEESYEFTWTLEMAKQAGISGGDNWRKYPWDMLYARAASHVARKVAPGRLLGVYAPEEITETFDPSARPSLDPEAEGVVRADADPLLAEATGQLTIDTTTAQEVGIPEESDPLFSTAPTPEEIAEAQKGLAVEKGAWAR